MNISNPRRNELTGIPFLNDAFDWINERIMLVWRKEHTDEGKHGDVTAESITVSGDVEIAGDLTVSHIDLGTTDDPIGVDGVQVGPDTFEEADDYPSASSTADITKPATEFQRDLIPDVDDENYLGWMGAGAFVRRWRAGYFSRAVHAPKIVGTTAVYPPLQVLSSANSIPTLGATPQTLPNGTTAQIGDNVGGVSLGFLFVEDTTNGVGALMYLRGGNQTVNEISDANTAFSTTAGTPASRNVYWSVGNARYEFENQTGGSISVRMWMLGELA